MIHTLLDAIAYTWLTLSILAFTLAMFRTRKDMSDNLPDEHTSLGIGS